MSHRAPQIVVRTARPEDVESLVEVEKSSWPPPLAATREEVLSRISQFPEGQLLAEVGGLVAGVVWAQRILSAALEQQPVTYDRITAHGTLVGTHDPRGDVYQLIAVGVAPRGRGLRLGRLLVDRQMALARSLPGVRRIVGFTRPVGYHRPTNVPIDEYLELRTMNNRPVDPMLAFHLGSGARLVSIHPQFRPCDTEACNYGVLIEYPLATHCG